MKAVPNKSILIAAIGILALAAILYAVNRPFVAEGSSYPTSPALLVATTTKSQAITVSAQVLATTTNALDPTGSYQRAYTVICNPNTNPVYLNLDSDKPASLGGTTYIIAAAAGYNTCFELTADRMIYHGSITASSTNQTSTTITVKDYVY